MQTRLSYSHDESARVRTLRGVRLSLGGGVLGTALVGMGAWAVGSQTQFSTDVIAAVAGVALTALYLFHGVDEH
jgi:hypothetical protein